MNFSVPGGFLLAAAVLYFALHGVTNASTILSPHAAIIVVGGTLSAAFICARASFLVQMLRVFLDTITGRRRSQLIQTLREVVSIAEHVNNGGAIAEKIDGVKNHFLKEVLILSERAGLDGNELMEVVEKRLEQQNERYRRDAYLFKTIGKFPPAFGLVGTTVGMIGLLQGLGAPDAFQQIGPSMSLALVATFYGLVLANFFLIPVGENLHLASEEDLAMRHLVADGARLLRERRHPLLVEEYLISYLPPLDRQKAKGVRSGEQSAKAA